MAGLIAAAPVCCSKSRIGISRVSILLDSKRNGSVFQNHRIRFTPPRVNLGDNKSDLDDLQEVLPVKEKWSGSSATDVIKLFNDTQKNMMYLNKQRLNAIEEVQKTRRDNEYLIARIAQLEAEYQASVGKCEVLNKRLQALGVGLPSRQTQAGPFVEVQKPSNPSSVWGELLLRVDSMTMSGNITLSQATGLRNLIRKRDAQAADVYFNTFGKDDRELSFGLLQLLDPSKRRGLHVIHICTEMAPIAQAGTLATYITGLSAALRKKGHMVEVIMPKYASADLSCLSNVREMNTDLYSYFGEEWHKNKLWTGVLNGVAVTLIEPSHPSGFFQREDLYDYDDDFERFTYFCRAALEYLLKLGKQPSILHIHNWQTAAIAPLFWDLYAKQGLQNTRILFTCHDFKYQCLQDPSKLSLCGLHPHDLHRQDRLQDNFETGLVNLLKGGIIYSNKVTTVSPLYANDVLSKDHGHGLDTTLTSQKYKFIGIQNGIDDFSWNPSTDRLIHVRYSCEDLSGKQACKTELVSQLQFPELENSTPLIGCIVPQVSEQDLELVRAALTCAMEKGAQFVFVGASKVPRIQVVLEDLQRESKNGHFTVKYDEALAHQIIAASDILVCPCLSEPSGQWPLIAMRYGTVPVARGVYGHTGSVIDAEDISNSKEATGYTFSSRQGSDLANSLTRAINKLKGDPEGWYRLMQNGMAIDHSWSGQCVESYEAAYWSICGS
ncbi:hypothetical protein R1flu_010828 [Riccia fluitans]|uniref:starch synthase n=1 Tax=Riccia fluitans TaxID=41844 RepID=A0ABD1Z631_9MARC